MAAPGGEGLAHLGDLGETARGDLDRELFDVGDLLVADLLDLEVERHRALADAERADRVEHQLRRWDRSCAG
ncbi:MAG: hypothetical protein WDN44_07450 [Sphingomonas sp.]